MDRQSIESIESKRATDVHVAPAANTYTVCSEVKLVKQTLGLAGICFPRGLGPCRERSGNCKPESRLISICLRSLKDYSPPPCCASCEEDQEDVEEEACQAGQEWQAVGRTRIYALGALRRGKRLDG